MFARATLVLCAGILIVPDLHGQAPKQARTDFYGDPLPDGAVARLGTLRFKHVPKGDPTIDVAMFSPDGKWIASLVYGHGSVRLHDAATGMEHAGPWTTKARASAMAFSPDGSMLAVAGTPNQGRPNGKNDQKDFEVIAVFDFARGKQVKSFLGKPENFRALAFADGNKTLVSAGNGTIRWWDVASGKELRSWQPFGEAPKPADGAKKPTKTFSDCALAPGAKSIAMHAYSYVERNPAAPNGPVFGGPQQVTEQEAIGINLATRKTIWRIARKGISNADPNAQRQGLNISDTRFAYSANGKCLAIAMPPAKLQLRDTETGKLLANPLTGDPASANFPCGLTISADGSMVALAAFNSQVTLWTADRSSKPPTYKERKLVARIAQFWQNSTHGVDFSPDGKTLLVAVDADIQRYNVATLKEINPADGHRGWIDYVSFAPDGKRLLTGCAGINPRAQEMAAWDTATWHCLQITSERAPPWRNFGSASPDQSVYVGKAGTDRFGLFDLQTGKLLSRIKVSPGNESGAWPGFFSPGGNFYVLPGQNTPGKNHARLYAVRSGKLRAEMPPLVPMQQPMEACRPYAFSIDERLLTYFSLNDGKIHIFDTNTGKALRQLGDGINFAGGPNQGMSAASLAFTRDGKTLASWNSHQAAIRIWDLATGKELLQLAQSATLPNVPNGMPGSINQSRVHFAWTPGGRCLAIGDNKIRVVELATLGVRQEFLGHTDGNIRALAISPDGRVIASGSSDTTVLIWDLAGSAGTGPALARPELAKYWQALAGSDAKSAFAAIRALAASPKETALWIGEQLKPTAAHDAKHVEELIDRLDDPRYAVRQKASAELLRFGERVLPAVEAALARNPTLEARRRLIDLRKRTAGLLLTGPRLQAYRAVEVLECIATADARKILLALAGGDSGAMLTTQARAALERLAHTK